MEVPKRVVEEAVAFMKQQRGNQALDLLRDYNVLSFGQLEQWCNFYGIPTWREQSGSRAEESRSDTEE